VLALLLGLAQAWASRRVVHADGISYLDMAGAISRGHWGEAVNGLWSPLYPVLLGLSLRIFRPSNAWEIPFAHLLNVVIYAGALGCFHFFLRGLLTTHRDAELRASTDDPGLLPPWALISLGFAWFTWTSLQLIHLVGLLTDLCVAAFVYLGAGLLLRIRRRPAEWRIYVILGISLGLGYWAKAPMFPMAFVFMFAAVLAARNLRIALPRVGASLLAFLIVATPLILAQSRAHGHLTYGESGRLNYAVYLDGIDFLDWEGQPPGTGTPKHPPRKILDEPPVYSFTAHLKGTYPRWYDPVYWLDGVKARFTLGGQARATGQVISQYYELFVLRQGLILGAIATLLILGGTWHRVGRGLAEYAFLLVVPLGGMCMYAPVHVEPRMVAAYVVLLWLGLLSAAPAPYSPESARRVRGVVIFMLVALGAQIAGRVLTDIKNQLNDPRVDWIVAEKLKRLGLAPGDTVAVAGDAVNPSWPHIAQLSIVAEIGHGSTGFWWAADPPAKSRVFQALAGTGAKALVADRMPAPDWSGDWQQIGNTTYFVHLLR
jgi:4-amino-4-deoxy-L-arabinose transferase-like glycosyltransferase